MDFQQLFSVLKNQNIKIPEEKGQSANVLDPSLVNLDLSSINQNVIEQVKKEYMSSTEKKSEEDKLIDATEITPDVLIHIANMAKKTDLLKTLKLHSERQHKIENELFEHRKSIKKRYEEQKKGLAAQELIGVKNPEAIGNLERDCQRELRKMDLHVFKEMDKLVKNLQRDLMKLKVPLFKETDNPKDIALQQKIVLILNSMI
ncbi:hypothetical protein BY458DRAFT_527104 [Sporodiniella umbellata]|nr:hypothetical protein BY458DRAFT_527104 [Sporodiniella umbellata]